MPEQEIRYIKGIDKDTAYSSYTPDKYYHLQNGKVITVDGSSTGAIEVENGNALLFRVPAVKSVYKITGNIPANLTVVVTINGHTNTFVVSSMLELASKIEQDALFNCGVFTCAQTFSIYGASIAPVMSSNPQRIGVTLVAPAQTGLKIIGMHELRDDLIVFTTNEASNTPDSYGQIWKVPINRVQHVVTGILAGGYLDDSTHLIYHGKLNFSTAYPITEAVVKVDNALYGKTYFTDGYNVLRQFNTYQSNLMALSPESFSIVPGSDLKEPSIIEMVSGGNYQEGTVRYTYRLYSKYGASTKFAPASAQVYLTNKKESEQYSTDYYGCAENTPTGKAVRIEIAVDDFSYDSIQIISIYNQTLYSTPIISVVADQANTSKVISVVDSHRDGAEEIDYVTFAALSQKEFVTQTLSVKDNFLIAMNNKSLDFNPDYDARAYRFKNNRTTYVPVDFGLSSWGVDEKADCINPYNDYTNYRSGLYDYKYKIDGTTPGGEGPNVSYEFKTVDFTIDEVGPTRTLYVETRNNVTVGTETFGDSTDFNFQGGYSISGIRGWMRNEIYRYGVVFYNKGKVSPVKWIADIRMPSAYEDNPFGTAGTGKGLFPVFTVSNPPLDDDGNPCMYQIVAVQREGQDMTVLANGYLDLTFENPNDGNNLNPTAVPFDWNNSAGPVHDTSVFRFICPETNFNKNIKYLAGDYLELNNKWLTSGWDYTSIAFAASNEFTFKLLTLAPVAPLVNPADRFIQLSDGIIGTAGSQSFDTIDGRQYENYCRKVASTYGTLGLFDWIAYNGTTLVLATSTTIDENMLVSGGSKRAPYVSYIRPRYNQYGGATYADRSRNEYIVASDIQSLYDVPIYAIYGDTFTEYFDYLDKMNVGDGIVDTGAGERSELQAYYLPVESTINLSFRHDTCYSRIGAPPSFPTNGAYRLCETVAMGNAVHGTDYYDQATDLYLYNPVYSRSLDAIKFYPLPFNLEDIKEFDTEIAISEKHLNNQYIDSWCSFLPNNVVYVDGKYGAIYKGVNYNNQIHFLQEGGFGLVSVNERISTVDQTGNTLVLGTGDQLGRFGYISYNTGTTEKTSVVVSGAGLHFFDVNSKKWMVYTQGTPGALSDVKGLIGHFNDWMSNYESDGHSQLKTGRYGVVAVNDNVNNRVIATFVKQVDPVSRILSYSTLSFNLMQNAFESFTDCHSPLYATYKNDVLMVNPSDLSECWYGQVGNRATFYGTIYDTYIQLISTLRGPTMLQSTVEFDSLSTDSGIDVFDDTFNFIRVSNSYQDSGLVPLVQDDTLMLPVSDENTRRLMRTWRIWVPRDNDENSTTYNPAEDCDARIRDKFAKIELRYTNTNNYRFVFHPIKTTFMANNY